MQKIINEKMLHVYALECFGKYRINLRKLKQASTMKYFWHASGLIKGHLEILFIPVPLEI